MVMTPTRRQNSIRQADNLASQGKQSAQYLDKVKKQSYQEDGEVYKAFNFHMQLKKKLTHEE